MSVTIVENRTTGTSYRIEQLWYIERETKVGIGSYWVRADTKDEAIEHAVFYGVPREQIRHVGKWGFNLDCPGVMMTFWRPNVSP